MRRVRQLEEKGEKPDYELILKDIEARDYQDSHRDYAPLKQAEDAVLVDTTDADLAQSEQMLLDVCKEKLRL